MKKKDKSKKLTDELLNDLILFGRCVYKEDKNGKIERIDPLTDIDEIMKGFEYETDN